jgi:hypothetical protein
LRFSYILSLLAVSDVLSSQSDTLLVTILLHCPAFPANLQTGTVTVDAATAANNPDRYHYDASSGGFYSPEACITLPGWQYDGYAATPCPKGWYNTADDDDASKCSQCPAGTTTATTGSTSVYDCVFVLPGWQYPSDTATPIINMSLCDIGECELHTVKCAGHEVEVLNFNVTAALGCPLAASG